MTGAGGAVRRADPGPGREPAAGRLELAFARGPDGHTYIARQCAAYPFHICRARHLEGDPPGMATLYLQSVSGGVFEGDRLAVAIEAGPGAVAHVTTQAATIVHAMAAAASQDVVVKAGPRAFVEYMPDPMILFPRARLRTRLRIEADDTATVICADAFASHDPTGAGGHFGRLDSETEVVDAGGALLARDRFSVTGRRLAERRRGVTGPYGIHATLLVFDRRGPPEDLAAALRGALEGVAGIYAGASTLPNDCGAWARLLAADGAALRAALLAAWTAVRLLLTGAPPAVRRK